MAGQEIKSGSGLGYYRTLIAAYIAHACNMITACIVPCNALLRSKFLVTIALHAVTCSTYIQVN